MNKNTRILITGCGGMLGEAVYHELKDKYNVYATDMDVNEKWLKYLDVRSLKWVKHACENIKPHVIIHLAALTDLEYCEKHIEEAYETNFMGTQNMCLMAKKYKIPIVYISSAGIFDGKKEKYNEFDYPNPINIYASSKYAGDLAVMDVHKHIIVRAGWMIGGGHKKDKKFVKKIIDQIINGSKELCVVKDKLGTPTYTYDLAKVIHYLLNDNFYGTVNATCDGGGSRYDVAKEILKLLDLSKKVKLKVVSSKYFKKEYFANRPYSEKMSNKELKDMNPYLIRDWRVCLEEYLKNNYISL
ncbi:MAG: SDR family oxidoreductase [Bacilli bacterium]|jgi:dTDP-4-dehydrorhamnose reductase